ncbi:unnamed protein product [Ilex paraguariensis]|uniref:Uncharacterized protein n=1 Tax=Ilex paraguariensis TaxID=185542 RepID=A0ABC8V1F2_9AQUA
MHVHDHTFRSRSTWYSLGYLVGVELLVVFISNISQLGMSNNRESLWRDKDARNSWRKKGEDSYNLASISGEPSKKENQHDDPTNSN